MAHISVPPEKFRMGARPPPTRRITQSQVSRSQASPLGLVLVVALFAFRGVLRPLIESHAAQWHLNALAVTEAFLVFALALIVLQRVEMFIRARRILAGRPDDHVEVAA